MSKKPLIIGAGITLLLAIGGTWLHLHEDTHQHSHGGSHGEKRPVPEAAMRWESEPQLRSSMLTIRDAVAAASSTAPVSNEAAQAIPKIVDEQIGLIVKNCKLAPEADETLHYILSDMVQGAQALSAENQRTEGIAKLKRALDDYLKYFNHPDWQPLPEDSKS